MLKMAIGDVTMATTIVMDRILCPKDGLKLNSVGHEHDHSRGHNRGHGQQCALQFQSVKYVRILSHFNLIIV